MFQHKTTCTIGGLNDVGFAPDSEMLLVLSAQGEGIFNGLTGERIARHSNDYDWWARYDEKTLTIKGFDFLSGTAIKISGLTGNDFLPKETPEGWELYTIEENDVKPFENYTIQKVYLKNKTTGESVFITKDSPCELIAYGFSDTGKSFVIALSCEVVIYSQSTLLTQQL